MNANGLSSLYTEAGTMVSRSASPQPFSPSLVWGRGCCWLHLPEKIDFLECLFNQGRSDLPCSFPRAPVLFLQGRSHRRSSFHLFPLSPTWIGWGRRELHRSFPWPSFPMIEEGASHSHLPVDFPPSFFYFRKESPLVVLTFLVFASIIH